MDPNWVIKLIMALCIGHLIALLIVFADQCLLTQQSVAIPTLKAPETSTMSKVINLCVVGEKGNLVIGSLKALGCSINEVPGVTNLPRADFPELLQLRTCWMT